MMLRTLPQNKTELRQFAEDLSRSEEATVDEFLHRNRAIDFESIEGEGDTFTLRERDSMAQKRITEAELFSLLDEQVY